MRKIDTVIIHHSLSGPTTTINDIRRWHKKRGFKDIGYHYVIEYDGVVKPGRPINIIGAHAKGRNRYSIGICVVGDFSKDKPLYAQYVALTDLLIYLREHHTFKVEFHHELCPGKNFDRSRYAPN